MRVSDFVTYDPETGVITPKDDSRPKERVRIFKSGTYMAISVNGVDYLSHRLAFLLMEGVLPEHHVDHINGNGLDNRWGNLRKVTNDENNVNKSIYKCNKTGVSGVTIRGDSFRVRIRRRGVLYNIGTYKTLDEARAARLKAEKDLGFHNNHGRSKLIYN